MGIKYREIVEVYLLLFATLGFYSIYWLVQTKDEINQFGANIPTAWLLIVPIANLYWFYRYAEGFSVYIKRDENAILWFLLFWFAGIIMPAIVQKELNEYAIYQ